jgi:transcription termination/antitermination protein NusG
MSASIEFCNPTATPTMGDAIDINTKWYALQTRARHEKVIAHRLREQGISTFLPLVTEVHRWSDRKKIVELPLFSCYLFAKLAPTNEDRSRVLRLDGVFQLVGTRAEGTPIPDEQIDAIRILVKEHIPVHSHPFLQIGQRVRIRSGALNGVEGILVARNGDQTLVVSIEAIQRSLAVRIEGYDVEPV